VPKPTNEPTLQEKYDWLCAKFYVHNICAWENDGLLAVRSSTSMYFQFSPQEPLPMSVDRAIVFAMQEETNKRKETTTC
jgi:hypothetical protein